MSVSGKSRVVLQRKPNKNKLLGHEVSTASCRSANFWNARQEAQRVLQLPRRTEADQPHHVIPLGPDVLFTAMCTGICIMTTQRTSVSILFQHLVCTFPLLTLLEPRCAPSWSASLAKGRSLPSHTYRLPYSFVWWSVYSTYFYFRVSLEFSFRVSTF